MIFHRQVAIHPFVVIATGTRLASRCLCATSLTSGPGWELATGRIAISSWDQHHCHRWLVKHHRLLLWILPRATSFPWRRRRIRLIIGIFTTAFPRTLCARRSVKVHSPIRPNPGIGNRPRFPFEEEVQREMMPDRLLAGEGRKYKHTLSMLRTVVVCDVPSMRYQRSYTRDIYSPWRRISHGS